MVDKFIALFNLFFAAFMVSQKNYVVTILAFGCFIISIANWIVTEVKKNK